VISKHINGRLNMFS